MSQFTQEYSTGCVLKAKIDNVKNISQLLKCVHFKDCATCFASQSGLKFVVEESKCVQAAAFVGLDVFQEYALQEELIGFRLDLNILVECLTIFDTPSSNAVTSLNLYYQGHGFPLRLILIEDDLVTDCSIKTLEAYEILHFSLPGENTRNKLIADGPLFKDLFSDLDPGSEYVDILMSPNPPHFQITTKSTSSKCQVSIAKDAEMIEEFQCSATATTRYKYSQIKPALKPLQASSKVALQTNEMGLLCFQFMVKTESKMLCYIEYYCTPVLSNEDD